MLNLSALIGAFAGIVVFVIAATGTYYLRPSRGGHANPCGAAVTVKTLKAERARVASAEPCPCTPTPGTPYGLLCGYADPPKVTIMDSPDEPALVRPYLDNPNYRRAAMRALLANEPTTRLTPVRAAA